LGGVIPAIPTGALGSGEINNPNFFTTDIRLSWRYRIRERLTIEPQMDCFNVFNKNNGAGNNTIGNGGNTALSGLLSGAAGTINGSITNPFRVGSGSGSFSSGTPRAFQFGIRVTF
jgi:hypothetical protein